MPATSEEMRKAACVAFGAKTGKGSAKELKGAAKSMYDSMSIAQLRDFCTLPIKK